MRNLKEREELRLDMDFGNEITMEKVEVPIHKHPLLPINRFCYDECKACGSRGYIYGGYRCNELGCQNYVYHKECAESLSEIDHSFHPGHPLKLLLNVRSSTCSRCGVLFINGYFCSICDFKMDLCCTKESAPLLILENSKLHEHPLELSVRTTSGSFWEVKTCETCNHLLYNTKLWYTYHHHQSIFELYFHVDCAKFFPEANHTSHPQHPLKLFTLEAAPDYADKKCLLCGMSFDKKLHHCDVCNFSICSECMSNPPPLGVISPTTHEHQLHLIPRRLDFTCNACGTQGDRSPYFCLQCTYMIHRQCIDLPRVININRHNHCISYTRRLGHGEWKCGVCRKIVNGFYGAYSCFKCSNYVVHSRCATRRDVWDMIELEGTLEEPEDPPFVVIDDNTIKHFSHDHNLQINNDGRNLEENKLCEACVFQICSDPFYSCEHCDFILHQKCANLPRKIRHVSYNQPFTLDTNYGCESFTCHLCRVKFNSFRYMSLTGRISLDVRCGSVFEPFVHRSHPHPLYFSSDKSTACNACGIQEDHGMISCDQCDFSLDFRCALSPQKVMRHRYDDHPLFLSHGESNVDAEYWCEACETKLNPKIWFYTCNDCGVTLHKSCVVGSFAYIMPGSVISFVLKRNGEVVPNTSICRTLCSVCNSRCKLPSILHTSNAGVFGYVCSYTCLLKFYLPGS